MIKIENWNGYNIRFVEHNSEWWAVAKDIADALNFRDANAATRKMPDKYKGTYKVRITSDKTKAPETQEMITLNEKGIYRLIMRSNKPEAETFQDWIYEVIKQLRQSAGLEGFEIFRMLDKEHQKDAMSKLKSAFVKPVRVDFIKANTIANKAVSNMYGYPKMIKKNEMEPDMLVKRQNILDETVNLMSVNEIFNLGISVSDKVYEKYKN